MDNFIAFCTGISSLGYIGHSIRKFRNYNNFMNDLHQGTYFRKFIFLEGSVLAPNGSTSFVQEYKGVTGFPLAVRNTIVETGKRHTGTHYYQKKIGNVMSFIPKNYDYVNWKTVYAATTIAKDVNFLSASGKIVQLLLNGHTIFFQNKDVLNETIDGNLIKLHTFLKKREISSVISDKLKVIENAIYHSEHVTLVGKYRGNSIDVVYIGSKQEVINAIRTDICGLKYPNIAFAGVLFVASIMYIGNNYFSDS